MQTDTRNMLRYITCHYGTHNLQFKYVYEKKSNHVILIHFVLMYEQVTFPPPLFFKKNSNFGAACNFPVSTVNFKKVFVNKRSRIRSRDVQFANTVFSFETSFELYVTYFEFNGW